MRNSVKMGCFLLALALLVPIGCSSKQEKAQEKVVGLMSDFAGALADIKSNTDFVDAKPKLERLGAQMKDARNEIKTLPAVSDAKERAQMDKAFEDQLKPISERIQKEMSRLNKIGVSPYDVTKAMDINMGELMGN